MQTGIGNGNVIPFLNVRRKTKDEPWRDFFDELPEGLVAMYDLKLQLMHDGVWNSSQKEIDEYWENTKVLKDLSGNNHDLVESVELDPDRNCIELTEEEKKRKVE